MRRMFLASSFRGPVSRVGAPSQGLIPSPPALGLIT